MTKKEVKTQIQVFLGINFERKKAQNVVFSKKGFWRPI
jgi:hypothetical protein